MPDIKTDDGCVIHAEVEGPQNGPVLMLSNSLGTNLHMWDEAMPGRKPGAAGGIFHVPNT
jgi:hypothetical protein